MGEHEGALHPRFYIKREQNIFKKCVQNLKALTLIHVYVECPKNMLHDFYITKAVTG